MTEVRRLGHEQVREALRLLGRQEGPGKHAQAQARLRELLRSYQVVREVLEGAPGEARASFVRLCHDGPARVEDLLGRGWWGHGTLPAPLDWLQRRALVDVGADGLVHAIAEAREGYLVASREPGGPEQADRPAAPPGIALQVEAVASVVVAPDPAGLDRALTVPEAGLRAVAPTVAVSEQPPQAVGAALRAAGVPLAADEAVPASPQEPALPSSTEEAVGPRAVRTLLERAAVDGRQVRLLYYASSRGGAATERVVDPWEFRDDLLRGYCHLRAGERSFAVDRIGRAALLPTPVEHPAP